MRKFSIFSLAVVYTYFSCNPTAAHNLIDSVIFSDQDFIIKDDTFINHNAAIYAERINVISSVSIVNNGFLDADIIARDGVHMYLQNSGRINGAISIGDAAAITQIIKSDADITSLDIRGAPFDVLIYDAGTLSVAKIKSATYGADKITVYNTSLILDSDEPALMRAAVADPVFELRGTVYLYVDDYSNYADVAALRNVTGDGTVLVMAEDIGPLHMLSAYVDNDDLFIRRVRITDYARILNNPTGRFLNDLRAGRPDDKLLRALDTVDTMPALNYVMRRSVRLRPKLLMRPVAMINNFEMSRAPDPAGDFSMSVAPMAVFSDEFLSDGVRANLGGRVWGGASISLSGYVAGMEYSDALNDYSARLYGGNVRMRYDLAGDWFADGVMGMTIARFDVGPVLDGEDVKYDPVGRAAYGVINFGKAFKFDSGLVVSPFVGGMMHRSKIVDGTITDTAVRFGADVSYSFELDGLRYNYSVLWRGGQGNRGAAIGGSVFSVADGVGGSVSLDMTEYAGVRAYKVSVNAKMCF